MRPLNPTIHKLRRCRVGHHARAALKAMLAAVLIAMLSQSLIGFAQMILPDSRGSVIYYSTLVSVPANERSMIVVPASAPAGTPRILVLRLYPLNGCSGSYYRPVELDLSTLDSGEVRIRSEFYTVNYICPPGNWPPSPRFVFYSFTVAKPGTTRIVFADPDQIPIVGTMTTTPSVGVPSRYDVNGMWYDVATNGSGISLHHSRGGSDAAFGTWFMFDTAGKSRWYSLQTASWQGGGDTLEGTLIETFGAGCPLPLLSACPTSSGFSVPTYMFRIRFMSATLASAEVIGDNGTVLFTSALRKLEL